MGALLRYLFWAVVSLTLALGATARIAADDAPHSRRTAIVEAVAKTRGEVWLRFQGGSMAPTLREGDLIRVRHVAPDALAFGDIVATQRPPSEAKDFCGAK